MTDRNLLDEFESDLTIADDDAPDRPNRDPRSVGGNPPDAFSIKPKHWFRHPLLWLVGTDPRDVGDLLREKVRYSTLALFIIISTVMSLVGMTYLLSTAIPVGGSSAYTGDWQLSGWHVAAGVVWATFILNFERWIASGIDYGNLDGTPRTPSQIRRAFASKTANMLVRVAVSLLVAFLISESLIYLIYKPEINTQLTADLPARQSKIRDEVRNSSKFQELRNATNTTLANDKAAQVAAKAALDAALDKLNVAIVDKRATAATALTDAKAALDAAKAAHDATASARELEVGGLSPTQGVGEGSETDSRRRADDDAIVALQKAQEKFDAAQGTVITLAGTDTATAMVNTAEGQQYAAAQEVFRKADAAYQAQIPITADRLTEIDNVLVPNAGDDAVANIPPPGIFDTQAALDEVTAANPSLWWHRWMWFAVFVLMDLAVLLHKVFTRPGVAHSLSIARARYVYQTSIAPYARQIQTAQQNAKQAESMSAIRYEADLSIDELEADRREADLDAERERQEQRVERYREQVEAAAERAASRRQARRLQQDQEDEEDRLARIAADEDHLARGAAETAARAAARKARANDAARQPAAESEYMEEPPQPTSEGPPPGRAEEPPVANDQSGDDSTGARTIINGRWLFIEHLHEPGSEASRAFGLIWKVRSLVKVDEPIRVLKLIKRNSKNLPLQEATVGENFRDSHLINYIDTGEYEGMDYIVIPWYREGSVAEFFNRQGNQGRRTLGAVLRILGQTLQGLLDLEEFRMSHRDIKPHNLLVREVDDQGLINIVVCDFGISRPFNSHGVTVTRGGTEFYMPGEQAMVDPKFQSSVDASQHPLVDIRALGATGYELIYGYPPLLRECWDRGFVHEGEWTFDDPVSEQSYVKDLLVDTPPEPLSNLMGANFPTVISELLAKWLSPRREDRVDVALTENESEFLLAAQEDLRQAAKSISASQARLIVGSGEKDGPIPGTSP